jgi:hypothetical protein
MIDKRGRITGGKKSTQNRKQKCGQKSTRKFHKRNCGKKITQNRKQHSGKKSTQKTHQYGGDVVSDVIQFSSKLKKQNLPENVVRQKAEDYVSTLDTEAIKIALESADQIKDAVVAQDSMQSQRTNSAQSQPANNVQSQPANNGQNNGQIYQSQSADNVQIQPRRNAQSQRADNAQNSAQSKKPPNAKLTRSKGSKNLNYESPPDTRSNSLLEQGLSLGKQFLKQGKRPDYNNGNDLGQALSLGKQFLKQGLGKSNYSTEALAAKALLGNARASFKVGSVLAKTAAAHPDLAMQLVRGVDKWGSYLNNRPRFFADPTPTQPVPGTEKKSIIGKMKGVFSSKTPDANPGETDGVSKADGVSNADGISKADGVTGPSTEKKSMYGRMTGFLSKKKPGADTSGVTAAAPAAATVTAPAPAPAPADATVTAPAVTPNP